MKPSLATLSAFAALSFLFSPFSAHAQTQQPSIPEDSVPESLKITGHGIQNELTKDITLMACVGESLTSNDYDCATLRLVKLAYGRSPVWISMPYKVDDISKMTEELAKTYTAQSVDSVFSNFHGDAVSAFTSKDGWNWANNPLSLDTKKYDKVVAVALFVSQYKYSKVEEYERALNESEKSGKQGCKIEGTFLAEAKERGSARSVIYSSTPSELIFTLCTHGNASVLKKLKATETNEDISFSGEHYKFNATKALVSATAKSYKYINRFMFGEEGAGGYYFFFGSLVGGVLLSLETGATPVSAGIMIPALAAAPWILPVAPVLGTIATVSVDAVITVVASVLDKDAIASRKFSKLMDEKSVKMKSSVFQSMVDHISKL